MIHRMGTEGERTVFTLPGKAAAVLTALLICFCGTGYADSGRAASLQDFAAAVETHTMQLDDDFTISCEASVIRQLKQPSPIGEDGTLLSELLGMAGSTGRYQYSWKKGGVRISDLSYYPGWRILRLWQNGRTEELSDRERQTLEAAQAIAAGASGTDLEKERYIYDALCDRITYHAGGETENFSENDCAVGALLNGSADCDGYADAMVLCCALAGIPCRYMHGDSRKPGLPDEPEGSHMWNLVCVDGTWLMCDATWGDQETVSYLYFNIGRQDAEESYEWCPETLLTDVAESADFDRHMMADQRPVTVLTQEDVYRAARSATSARQERLTLFCPGQRLWETDWDTFRTMVSHGGMDQISYNRTGRLFEMINQSIPETFGFCDTEADILSMIDLCADRDIRGFTLYLSPAVSGTMLADDCRQLRNTFSLSRLENPGMAIQYSEQSGYVTLSGAAYIDPLPVCSSREEILSFLNSALPGRPDELEFIPGDGYTPDELAETISEAVYSHGASSFRSGTIGSRVKISDITYYDNFCLASSEKEVADYLQKARKSGMKEIRIYCTPALYASLHDNQSSRFFTLLQNAGFSVQSISYNDHYGLLLAEDL